MAWINPVPDGVQTRGFAPAPTNDAIDEEAMYADAALRKAHNIPNGYFEGATYYADFHAALDIAAKNNTTVEECIRRARCRSVRGAGPMRSASDEAHS